MKTSENPFSFFLFLCQRASEGFLTVSSSSSLRSPLCLLWRKALALPDLAILTLASLAFWKWEEKEVRLSDKVGRRLRKITKALFNEKSLPSIHQNCIGIFTAIQEVMLAFRWGFSSFNVRKAVSAAYCVLECSLASFRRYVVSNIIHPYGIAEHFLLSPWTFLCCCNSILLLLFTFLQTQRPCSKD